MATVQSNEKRVWIIGAGASAGHSDGLFPTMAGLPAAAMSHGILAEWHELQRFDELDEYCQRHYSVPFRGNSSLNWEELLTNIDISLAVSAGPEQITARATLVTAIRNTIRILHDTWATRDDASAEHREYALLRKHLAPNDTIITFNWDLLLDDALGRLNELSGHPTYLSVADQYSNFIGALTGIAQRPPAQIGVPEPRYHRPIHDWGINRSYYLKLHGSLDWCACANDRCSLAGDILPLLDYGVPPLCGACVEPMDALIVPPSLDKKLHSSSWSRRLWAYAARELTRATELVIWGYSLPVTDFNSKWLLRQAVPGQIRKISIVNPAAIQGNFQTEGWNVLDSQFMDHLKMSLPAHVLAGQVKIFESAADYFGDLFIEMKYPALSDDVAAEFPIPQS